MDFTDTLSDCDIYQIHKSQQKAHPKKTVHVTTGPMELVYTDLTGPIKPAAKGGYVYASKFTDDFARMNEIFLLKSKDQAVDSLRLYSQTVAVPLGLRIQRIRGTEYTSSDYQGLCNDSGTLEATRRPRQGRNTLRCVSSSFAS